MVAAGAIALVSWEAGLALATLVTLFYVLPPPTPVYSAESPVVEGEE